MKPLRVSGDTMSYNYTADFMGGGGGGGGATPRFRTFPKHQALIYVLSEVVNLIRQKKHTYF